MSNPLTGSATAQPDEALERYSRHLLLPEIGIAGHRRIRAASVCVVGLGGLGSPVAIYLAASGVGRLGLVDHDSVDLSNLQRQVVHSEASRGRNKAEAARDQVNLLNPEVRAVAHPVHLARGNAIEILGGYDILIDCSDNFATRYLVNDAAYLLDRPLVHGSLFRFEGQVSDFVRGHGCYRCLYPEPPPPDVLPACNTAGVLAALPGIIGSIQAAEALKLITGAGRTLVGRLLLHDSLSMSFREVRARHHPGCVLCGDHPTLNALIDYDAFVGGPATPSLSGR